MDLSVIITSFKRANLLRLGLASFARQRFRHEWDIIVVNDGPEDDTKSVCQSFPGLNIKYFSTRCPENREWRIPGFAVNVGVRQSDSPVIIISCAEMYLVDDDIINTIWRCVRTDPRKICITKGKDDDSTFLGKLSGGRAISTGDYLPLPVLNTNLPFFMGLQRQTFVDIGGYDEDFTGIGYDDDDLVGRLLSTGMLYHQINRYVVHLYHDRPYVMGAWNSFYAPRRQYNEKLYRERRGQVKRNEGRQWGNLS